jgi:tetratricopeptide (TPR) repeat protein
MSSQGITLSEHSEKEWGRMQRVLEMSAGFWLGFVFSPAARDAFALQMLAEELTEAKGLSFVTFTPKEPQELATAYQFISSPSVEHAGCIWVRSMRLDSLLGESRPWQDAWDQLFLRINERRDLLRKRLKGGLVFAAPVDIKPRVRNAAPDFWSVRDLVIDLRPHGQQTDNTANTNQFSILHTGGDRASGLFDLRSLFRDETAADPEFALEMARHASAQHPAAKAEALLAASDAFIQRDEAERAKPLAEEAVALLQDSEDILAKTHAHALLAEVNFRLGIFNVAQGHIQIAIDGRRVIAAEEVPLYWLAMAGEVEFFLGRIHEAKVRYREGLEILDSVRWRGSVDAPRGRIYLRVQLGIACYKEGDLEAAVNEFRQCVEIAHELFEQGNVRMTIVLSVVLKWLGDVWDAMGETVHAEAAYGKAVAMDRRAYKESPNSTLAMSQLSVALNRLGAVKRKSGDRDDLDEAYAAFEEALTLRREIVRIDGRNEDTLRALLSSLKKVKSVKSLLVVSKRDYRAQVSPLDQEIESVTAEFHALKSKTV